MKSRRPCRFSLPMMRVTSRAPNCLWTVERRRSDTERITMSQDKNIAIAQQLLAGIGEGSAPETLAAMFAEDLRFEIQGDDGVLPWIGHKNGRQAAARSEERRVGKECRS